jgi:uncharacterized delta-60 repeat protein
MHVKYLFIQIIILFQISNLYSAAGTLDTTFGELSTGIVIADIGRTNNLISAAIDERDNIYTVGTVTVTSTVSGICSFTSNGIFNNEFNASGYAQLIADNAQTAMQSIAMQSDGKAVIGGQGLYNGISKYILARYTLNGSLDIEFGKGLGYVVTDIAGGSSINAIIIQPSDGKILAGGLAGQGTPSFTLARYNSDGTLDTSFGNKGFSQAFPGYVSTIQALGLQKDGKILAAGYTWNLETDVFALARFNEDGTLDETFGTKGIVTQQIGTRSQARSILIQPDNYIVLGGWTTHDSIHYSFALTRFDSNGNLDKNFNESGIVITNIDYSSGIQALALQRDNKIIAGGYNFGLKSTNFALARYLTDGTLDSSFGSQGITCTQIGSTAQINSLMIQSDDKIVAAGISDTSAALARYFA